MVFNMLAGGGFTLFIPILGGMIAQSIAGRAALAPAMILSYVLNLGGAPFHDIAVGPFFNYGTGDFTAMAGAQLGFLGAIAAGYMVGYGINFMTKYTDKVKSQAFQTMLPLLIIPLTFTILP
jgi:fructose-specific phosphotransferase system IIC component